MKKILRNHFYFGRLASRTEDEFLLNADDSMQARPSALRWFCGMHDMEGTFICQML